MRATDLRRTFNCRTLGNLHCIEFAVLFLLLGSPAIAQNSGFQPRATAYINGYWFDGNHFSRRTVYVRDEILTFHRPSKVDATVDLKGGYVVPPFAESHNHNVEPLNDIPKLVATYLEHGIFYVKDPDNLPRDKNAGISTPEPA
jgi:hypothetical protein